MARKRASVVNRKRLKVAADTAADQAALLAQIAADEAVALEVLQREARDLLVASQEFHALAVEGARPSLWGRFSQWWWGLRNPTKW